jgi:hypothetical protein
MERPLPVEIIAYAPTAFYHCTHCEVTWHEIGIGQKIHAEQVSAALPEDIAREYQAVSDWVRRLFQEFGDRVVVKVIDAASPEGFWKSLRYGLRRYPAVVVGEGKARYTGTDFQEAELEVARHLSDSVSLKESE